MKVEGGCYCGEIRYKAEGEPIFKAECYCRECQYITGGANLLAMAMPGDNFEITKGAPKGFARGDIDDPVTRHFCDNCGTHLMTTTPRFPQGVILKVGTLDDPSMFGKADSANFASDAQSFHRLPDDMPVHQKWMR
ncbi:GFA family protein [Sphingorhabdus sp. Alg239-R122]|uniref:GFA family protein n=1 Tax=Sphingorhabdus sp. Alg239-R122 TaxID=2305989 RepID=UPI0013D9152B|nr:GFA family protein [Sphingorhabdus sp. Alg239-R122]